MGAFIIFLLPALVLSFMADEAFGRSFTPSTKDAKGTSSDASFMADEAFGRNFTPAMKHDEGTFTSSDAGWQQAHATFYNKTSEPNGPVGGACGYSNQDLSVYGYSTAALSQVMFEEGAMCGACYEIRCVADIHKWCVKSSPITVTATNLCPPNDQRADNAGGWCNGNQVHFDIWETTFVSSLAKFEAGIVTIEYRKVPCSRTGGIEFTIRGSEYYNLVLVSNVGGSGDVKSVEIKGSNPDSSWMSLNRNWGALWQFDKQKVAGQSLSFRITTGDGGNVTSLDVIPPHWEYNHTYTNIKAQFQA